MLKTKAFWGRELLMFLIGGSIYVNIEVFVRMFSHWSMFICGGLAFVIIGLLNEWYNEHMLFQHQCIVGSFVITALEFIFGYIFNILLGMNIWDYSNNACNLYGQVCLSHSIYWLILSAVAIILDDQIRHYVFDEPFPKYYFIHKKEG